MEIDEEKLGFEFQDAKLMKKHVGDQIQLKDNDNLLAGEKCSVSEDFWVIWKIFFFFFPPSSILSG